MNEDDHAFFDDDFNEPEKMTPKKVDKNGKNKSQKPFHCDLHGTPSIRQQLSSDSSDNDDEHGSKSSPPPSQKSSQNNEDIEEISKPPDSPFVLTSSDSEDDTLTDVSPRSSPEASPRVKRSFRFSFSEEELADEDETLRHKRKTKKVSYEQPAVSSSDEEEEKADEVKHITKLNVTFKSRDSQNSDHSIQEVPSKSHSRKSQSKAQHRTKKRHKGQGDTLSIDHIEGSLSRYFEKDKSSARPKSAHIQVRPSVPVNNNNSSNAVDEAGDRVDGKKLVEATASDLIAAGGGVDEDGKPVDLNHLLEIILDLEEKGVNVKEKYKEQSSRRQASRQESRQQGRKNMSFSNEQAREIQRENSRLYKELTKRNVSAANRSRPGSSTSMRSRQSVRSNMSSRTSTSAMSNSSRRSTRSAYQLQQSAPKPYHSAVNRINLQRQIERENMQILKRLQEAKPTESLQRNNQLRDYQKQTRYMGSAIPHTSTRSRRKFTAELSRDREVIQQALDIGERRFRQIRTAWQDVW